MMGNSLGPISSVLFLACASTPAPPATNVAAPGAACTNALPLVTIHGVRGVVLPSAVARRDLSLRRKDAESYWVPAEDDVAELEASLGDALKARLGEANKEPPSAQRDDDIAALTHIVKHLGEYLRQYAGMVVNGGRRVLVNAFPADTYCYRDELVVVKDGGPWFWTIQYDVKLHQFLHWELSSRDGQQG
jgi:hypothetical protein